MSDSDDDQSPALAQLSDEDEDPEEVEQVDQELEEQRDEVDMDISNSPIQVHHRDERREDIKYEGLGGQWGPGSSTWGKAEARPPSNILDMAESTSNFNFAGTSNAALRLKPQKTFAGARNDARILSGKKTSTHHTESQDHVKNGINSKDEMQQVVQSTNDGKQMESRSAASERGTHIMSPETNDPNKRPAIVCDFYAKGWCIRGTSCRFIHTKDSPNNSHPQPEGDAAAASCSKEVKVDEGLRVIPERSRLPGFHDPLASSSGYSFPLPSHLGVPGHHQLQSVQYEEPNVGDSADVQKLHLHKDDLVFLTSYKDVGKDDQIRNRPTDKYNNSPNKKGRYSTGNTSSHSSSMEDLAGVWRQRVHGDHTSPLVSHSLNTGSNTLIATGLFPSSRISNWTGFSLPASYSNLDAHPVGSRKLLDSNRDYHAYTRPSAFLKSSELNTVSQHSAELKTKISSNNWEPSVPFRPSCILPSAFLSFSAQQYDPLRSRIELPKLANNSFEASFYSEGATAGKRLHQKVLPETVGGTRPPACDADTNSMSSHNTYQEKVLDNSCYTRDPTSPVTETETVGISVVYQNGTLTKDENPMGHSQVKGSTNPNKISICGDSRHQSDGSSSHQRDIKVDKFRENNEVEGEHLTDGDVQQESKEMKQFRGALIELVKELLKPKWREGSLSKDAHNKIVKKAVDKILSAFQPQQIPPTLEAVTQYLSACRPKISKLVEGYIERYGKS
uniref:protein FRIGIDA-ESSENTIAL 1 isoform X2 n=1 Tax=Fragaria vesca subsp. vesca TaxID=101020 RepID=UPI0005C8E869|nr:PREDICTED: protein FRIGIDA-ESSENTIAL 1 isoform X2 [Fragaria vesca subsp. vesca]